MADSALQQQLDEVRAMLARARELFGPNPVEPPTDIAPDPDSAKRWLLYFVVPHCSPITPLGVRDYGAEVCAPAAFRSPHQDRAASELRWRACVPPPVFRCELPVTP